MVFLFEAIPLEVWTTVFDFTTSTQQLAECRLVCRAWDRYAEKAMFKNGITIRKKANLEKLYHRLQQVPDNGRFVEYLYIYLELSDLLPTDFEALILEIVKLVFTPNMVELWFDGFEYDDTLLYKTLYDISVNSTEKFTKLKRIPNAHKMNQEYVNALTVFKESLEHINFDFLGSGETPTTTPTKDVIYHLDQYKKLSQFCLLWSATDLPELESVLKNATQLEFFYFAIVGPNSRPWSTEAVIAWCQKNVKTQETLEILKFCFDSRIDYLIYLLYKYPKLKDLEVLCYTYLPRSIIESLLYSAAKMEHLELRFRIRNNVLVTYFEEICRLITRTSLGKKIALNLDYYSRSSNPELVTDCTVVIDYEKKSECTVIGISLPTPKLPNLVLHQQLLESIGSSINTLNLDLMSHVIEKQNINGVDVIMNVIRSCNYLTTFRLCIGKLEPSDQYICMNTRVPGGHTFKELEIYGAVIDDLAIQQLSCKFERIEKLVFRRCYIFKQPLAILQGAPPEPPEELYSIAMPRTIVDSLHITTESLVSSGAVDWMNEDVLCEDPTILKHLESVREQSIPTEPIFVKLKLVFPTDTMKNEYFLVVDGPRVRTVSAKDYSQDYNNPARTIDVCCAPLHTLSLQIGHIKLDISTKELIQERIRGIFDEKHVDRDLRAKRIYLLMNQIKQLDHMHKL